VLPSSVEVIDAIENSPVVSVSKTAMRLDPLMVVTPVIPSREVMSVPEIV